MWSVSHCKRPCNRWTVRSPSVCLSRRSTADAAGLLGSPDAGGRYRPIAAGARLRPASTLRPAVRGSKQTCYRHVDGAATCVLESSVVSSSASSVWCTSSGVTSRSLFVARFFIIGARRSANHAGTPTTSSGRRSVALPSAVCRRRP